MTTQTLEAPSTSSATPETPTVGEVGASHETGEEVLRGAVLELLSACRRRSRGVSHSYAGETHEVDVFATRTNDTTQIEEQFTVATTYSDKRKSWLQQKIVVDIWLEGKPPRCVQIDHIDECTKVIVFEDGQPLPDDEASAAADELFNRIWHAGSRRSERSPEENLAADTDALQKLLLVLPESMVDPDELEAAKLAQGLVEPPEEEPDPWVRKRLDFLAPSKRPETRR